MLLWCLRRSLAPFPYLLLKNQSRSKAKEPDPPRAGEKVSTLLLAILAPVLIIAACGGDTVNEIRFDELIGTWRGVETEFTLPSPTQG